MKLTQHLCHVHIHPGHKCSCCLLAVQYPGNKVAARLWPCWWWSHRARRRPRPPSASRRARAHSRCRRTAPAPRTPARPGQQPSQLLQRLRTGGNGFVTRGDCAGALLRPGTSDLPESHVGWYEGYSHLVDGKGCLVGVRPAQHFRHATHTCPAAQQQDRQHPSADA